MGLEFRGLGASEDQTFGNWCVLLCVGVIDFIVQTLNPQSQALALTSKTGLLFGKINQVKTIRIQ